VGSNASFPHWNASRCPSARSSPGCSRRAWSCSSRSVPGLPHRRRGGQPLRLPGARRARLQVRPLPPPRRADRSVGSDRSSDPATRRCCARSPSATSPTEPARR
jgi:hypothetical protein